MVNACFSLTQDEKKQMKSLTRERLRKIDPGSYRKEKGRALLSLISSERALQRDMSNSADFWRVSGIAS